MIVNQLHVVPTPETLDYLNKLVSSVFLDLFPDQWRVELISTTDEIVADPTRVYRAGTSHFKPWYDQNLGTSSLILTLLSPDLFQRVQELGDEGVGSAFYETYNPHIVCIPYMPPLNSNVKRAMLSLANVFGANNTELTFTGELVSTVNIDAPPEFNYNVAMDEENGY